MCNRGFEPQNGYNLSLIQSCSGVCETKHWPLKTFKAGVVEPVCNPFLNSSSFSLFSVPPSLNTSQFTQNIISRASSHLHLFTDNLYLLYGLVKKILIQLLVAFRYKVNWSCRVSLIFSRLICTVFNLI